MILLNNISYYVLGKNYTNIKRKINKLDKLKFRNLRKLKIKQNKNIEVYTRS
jgi:hypothetical protein